MASMEALRRALVVARDSGDVELMEEVMRRIEAQEVEESPQGAMTRFSRGALGAAGSLADMVRERQAELGGFTVEPGRNMAILEGAGVTDPSALTDPSFAGTMGRQVPGLIGGVVARPAAAGAEVAGALGGGVGEFVGRGVGGDTGALIGGLGGSLTGAGAAATTRAALGGADAAAANRAANQALPGAGLSLGDTGGSPVAQLVDRITGKLPGGNVIARRRATRIALAASQKADDALARLAGPRRFTPEVAGRALEKGFKTFQTASKTRAKALFNDLRSALPEGAATPSSYIRRVQELQEEFGASGAAAKAFGRGGSDYLDEISEGLVANINEGFTRKQLFELRTRIAEDLSDINITGTPKEGIAAQLYGAITEDLKREAAAAGKLREFERANGFWRAFRAKEKLLHREVMSRNTPSKIFEALERSARSGPETVRSLRRSIPKDQWEMSLRVLFRRMGQMTPGTGGAIDPEDISEFSLNTFLTNWRRFSQNGGMKELLAGQSPQSRSVARDLTTIAKTAVGTRDLEQALINRSNTGEMAVNLGTAMLGFGGTAAGFGAWALPFVAGAVGGSTGAQKLLESPRFISWLAASTKLPAGQIPAHIERLEKVLEDEPGAEPLARPILEALTQ